MKSIMVLLRSPNFSSNKMSYFFNVLLLSHFSRVRLFTIPWAVACQAPLSMGFPRQEYWSGLPCPLTGNLPNSGIKAESLMSSVLTGGSLPLAPPGKPQETFMGA